LTSKTNLVFITALAGYVLGRSVELSAYQQILSYLISVFVFTTIFPSMLLFRFERLKISKKPLFASLFLNFVFSPLYAFLVFRIVQDETMSLSLASLLLMPVPSMNAMYVLISGGALELSVSLMTLNFLMGIALYPILLSLLTGIHGIEINIFQIVRSLLVVIVLPIILGQMIGKFATPSREIISRLTEISLNALVFTVFFSKAEFVHPSSFLVQFPYSAAFILGAIILSEVISWIMRIPKAEHLSYVFVSAGKNNSTVIAILTLSLSPIYAVYVMFHQFIQIFLLLMYARIKAEKII